MSKIHLAHGLVLPVDCVTQTFLIVGKRGSGKTTTAVRLAEQFHHAKQPFVVIDPVDSWWGLKASKDGKGPGLAVYVFGGRHADLPLEPTGGVLVADVVIENRISAVLSMKHFSGRERARFVSEFAERLFQRARHEPLHVFLEEAHEVAPQNPYKGEEEMLGRVTRIWKLGRSAGLGGSAITQRPASLSKNITTQAEILIVHRMLGPQDVAAIREWIKYHGESDDVLSQLGELKTGEAWIWAPDFPENDPIGLKRVKILDRETFDSSATPKAGLIAREPKRLAKVDLAAIETKMAETIQRAKADDPRELRKEIAELKRKVAHAVVGPPPKPPPQKRIEVPILTTKQVKRLERAAIAFTEGTTHALGMAGEIVEALRVWHEAQKVPGIDVRLPENTSLKVVQATKTPALAVVGKVVDGADLADTQHRILQTISVLNARGIEATRVSVARWMGIHPGGGRYLTDLARLREIGELSGMMLMVQGRVNHIETGQEAALRAADLKKPGCRAILEKIIETDRPLTRVELAELLGIHPGGGRYLTNLARLREMGLIASKGQPIRATEGLFR